MQVFGLFRPGIHAVQLADSFATGYLEASLLQHSVDFRLPEEIDWAAADILQPDLSRRHSPGPESRPGRQELLFGDAADNAKALGRLHDVIPESDGDRKIEFLGGLPVQDVGFDEITLIGRALLFNQFAGELQHVGRDIHSGDMLRSALGKLRNEPPGPTADVANSAAADLPR